MSSLIEGYNYDIFISYRQKDNKGDHWVSEFVEALRTELESTFKEEISVYFDINPHDGLLETHDVDASLKEKLRCLIFIPIISRTYCDPKSFAWENEFKAFVKVASKDQFGLKVKLPNGNVAGRVLPVQIHDIDENDIDDYYSVLNGTLRGIEFIYKESGINRPLYIKDNEEKNLNRTNYRNQINKVALAIKEIAGGMTGKVSEPASKSKGSVITKSPAVDKSIIVLPFDNLSPDPQQEYFSDGLTEEIITDLSYIHDLLVISRSSAMTFKGSKKTIPEIATEVNVRYVLEGSVRKSGNNLRIVAQLIDAKSDSHIWAEKFSGTLDDIFDIQEKVSASIAGALKLKLKPEEPTRNSMSIKDIRLFDLYLQARNKALEGTTESIDHAVKILDHALDIFGDNSFVLTAKGEAKYMRYELGTDFSDQNLSEIENLAKKALILEPQSASAYKLFAFVERGKGNLKYAYQYLKIANKLDPNDPAIFGFLYCFLGTYFGKYSDLQSFENKLNAIDPFSPYTYLLSGVVNYMKGDFGKSAEYYLRCSELFPHIFISKFWLSVVLASDNQTSKAIDTIKTLYEDNRVPRVIIELALFFINVINGEKDLALKSISKNTIGFIHKDPDLPVIVAGWYCIIDEKEIALKYLDQALMKGFCNYQFLAEKNPFYEKLRKDVRFVKIMDRMKFEWENFENV